MASSESTPSLVELADQISKSAAQLSEWLKSENHPQPTLSPNGPTHFPTAPASIHAARDTLLENTRLLHTLAMWPQEASLLSTFYSYIDASAIRWFLHFKIHTFVPLSGTASYASVAQQANVPEAQLIRILRHVMSVYFFREPAPGQVAHTALSALLVTDPPTLGQFTYGLEVIFPSAATLPRATEAIVTGGVDPALHTASGFNINFGTDMHNMAWTAAKPELMAHFAAGMRAFQENPWYDVRHVIRGYDWGRLGEGGHVVDVGGNDGAVDVAIAKAFPGLRFTVQDLGEFVKEGKRTLPEEMKGRIEFQVQDFFEENKVKDGDVYLLKFILHDWPDADAVRILKALVPSLKKGGRILVADTVLGVGDVGGAGRWNHAMDLTMWSLFNGKERTREDFERLAAEAGEGKLEVKSVWSESNSVTSLVEIGCKDE